MSAKLFTAEEAAAASLQLITNGKGTQAVHDVIVAMRANRRTGTACTKTKGEVAFSGSKPWRQKGTGRARAGYKSSPIWRGGGVVFGPKPRDYSIKVPKAIRKLAFRKALSERILAGDVFLVDSFAVSEPKTKQFVSLVHSLIPDAKKILIIAQSFDNNTYLAARNVATSQLITADEVNTEQLLAYDKIILVQNAVAKITQRANP